MTEHENLVPLSSDIDMTGIDKLPSGRFRFRVYHGKRVISGTMATVAEAKTMRDELLRQIIAGDLIPIEGLSLKNIGPKFLASRSGNRDSDNDESRWHKHIATASFANKPMDAVTRADGLLWLEDLREKKTGHDPAKHGVRKPKPLSWQTRKHCLNIARKGFAWAVEREMAKANPFLELRVVREDGDEDEGYQENWYLDAKEQQQLLATFDDVEWDAAHELHRKAEKWLAQFAFSTGLRQGEQWCLHLTDVHVEGDDPHVFVRYGSWDPVKERFRPPKGKKGEKRTRNVPLWGPSLEAAKAWLNVLPTYAPANPLGLMFPTERGKLRDRKAPRSWGSVVEVLGAVPRVGRELWWHLLRHTCASSMLSGVWGLRWSIEDVQKILGHQDVRTTQRYAHLAPAAVRSTADRAQIAWLADRHATVTRGKGKTRTTGKNTGRATEDSNLRPSAPEADALSS